MFINSVYLRPKLVVCPCFDRLFFPFFSWSTSTRDYKREPVPLAGTIFPIRWYQKFRLVGQKVPIGEKVGTKFRGMRKDDASWQEGVRRERLLPPISLWKSTSVAGVTDILKQIKFDGFLKLFEMPWTYIKTRWKDDFCPFHRVLCLYFPSGCLQILRFTQDDTANSLPYCNSAKASLMRRMASTMFSSEVA